MGKLMLNVEPFQRDMRLQHVLIERREAPNAAIESEVSTVIDDFLRDGEPVLQYWQTETRGRSCFVPLVDDFIIDVKGIGANATAIRMSDHWDMKFRTSGVAGEVQSVRVDDDSPFPVSAIALFDHAGGEVALCDAVVIGLSVLSDVVSEYELSKVAYENLGIVAVRSVAMMSHDVQLSWTADLDVVRSKMLLRARFRQALRDVGHALAETEALHLVSLPEHADKGGLLVRIGQGEARLQDLLFMALREEWGELRLLFERWRCLVDGRRSGQEFALVDALARTSAQMLNNGVVHGQLFWHLQNINIPYGELCDFDHTVISAHHNPQLAKAAREALERRDQQLGTESALRFDAMSVRFCASPQDAASALVEQSFFLLSAALRFVDLLERSVLGGTARSGAALDKAEMDSLRQRFREVMVSNLTPAGRQTVGDLPTDSTPEDHWFHVHDGHRSIEGWTSVLGWQYETRPFNPYVHVCTAEDGRAVANDYLAFANSLLEVVEFEASTYKDAPMNNRGNARSSVGYRKSDEESSRS
jgi:hypothetical protein